jgi:hypothetical protein
VDDQIIYSIAFPSECLEGAIQICLKNIGTQIWRGKNWNMHGLWRCYTVAHTPPTSKASLMYRFFVVPAVHVSNSWPIRRPNPKLISNRIPITSNKVLYGRPILGVRRSITQIWVSSLLETYLQKGFSFGSYCWRRQKMDIKPFACSATQTWNESCILGNNCWKQSKLVVGMF